MSTRHRNHYSQYYPINGANPRVGGDGACPGGTPDKPVGTVWMAIALEGECITKKINLGDNRERNIQMTIFASLNMLRNVLSTKRS